MSVWKITGEVDRGSLIPTVYREYTQDASFALDARWIGSVNLPSGERMYLRVHKTGYQNMPEMLQYSELVHREVSEVP